MDSGAGSKRKGDEKGDAKNEITSVLAMIAYDRPAIFQNFVKLYVFEVDEKNDAMFAKIKKMGFFDIDVSGGLNQKDEDHEEDREIYRWFKKILQDDDKSKILCSDLVEPETDNGPLFDGKCVVLAGKIHIGYDVSVNDF